MARDGGDRRRKRLRTVGADLEAFTSSELGANEQQPKETAQTNGHVLRTGDEAEMIFDEKTSTRKTEKSNVVLRSRFVCNNAESADHSDTHMKEKKVPEGTTPGQLGKEVDALLSLRRDKHSGGAGSFSDVKESVAMQGNATPGPTGTSSSSLSDDQKSEVRNKVVDTDELKKEEAEALNKLKVFVGERGGELEDGWQVESLKKRGKAEQIFISPDNQKFRSQFEVAKFLGILEKMEKKLGKGRRPCSGHEENDTNPDLHTAPFSQKVDPLVFLRHHGKESEVYKPDDRNPEKEEGMMQLDIGQCEDKVSPSPALVGQRCRDVLCHLFSADDFGTLCNMFQGAPLGILENGLQSPRPPLSGGAFDFQLVSLRMAAGAYGETPEKFLADLQQVWKNILSLGTELVRLSESLSKLSEVFFKEQVLSLYSVKSEVRGRLDSLNGAKNPVGKPSEAPICSLYQTESEQPDKQWKRDSSQPESKQGLLSFQELEANSQDFTFPSAMKGVNKPGVSRQSNGHAKKSLGSKSPKTLKAMVEERACRICGLKQGTDCLICSLCKAGYHTYCLIPTMAILPDSAWCCPTCTSTAVVSPNQLDEIKSGFNGGTNELSLIPEQTCEQLDQISEAGKESLKITSKDGVCKACGKDDDHVLLCDSCDAAYHMQCLKPALDGVPDGNWYCPLCVAAGKGPKEPHIFYKVGESIENGKLEEPPHHCAVCDRIDGTALVPIEQALAEHPVVGSVERACRICGFDKEKNSIISCDACAKLYHMSCLKPPLRRVPTKIWYCPSCLCRVCKVDMHDEMILLCDSCDEGYHTYCLSPPLAEVPEGTWFCPSCALTQEPAGKTDTSKDFIINSYDSPMKITQETGAVELPKRKRKSTEPKRST